MATQSHANTIYLTEKDAGRIRQNAQTRIKLCAESKGNAREPREALPSIQQATGASLMADMGGAPDPDLTEAQGGSLPAIAVGEPYAPSTAQDLEEMSLADLKMETHHYGKKLVVKRASPVCALAVRSWCMVQDAEGKETERLEMHLHKLRHAEEYLEESKNFIIKEPYFTLTEQGEATIRIDHPSDLVILTDEVANYKDAEKAATSCKKKGNTALKEKDLVEAHARYSEGLRIAEKESLDELTRDIARNRAYVNLLLNQLDAVKVDAKTSLINKDDERSKDLDSKAYFRAGSAAYALGQYEEAQKFFTGQQKLTPDDKDGKIYLKRIAARLKEQDTGNYDFTKMRVNLSKTRSRVDAANFTKNTVVKKSPGKGNGLFAARDIAPGELVMCEKALCTVWGHERDAQTGMTYDSRDARIRVLPIGLSRAIVQKLLANPSQIEKFMQLYGDWQGSRASKDNFASADDNDAPIVDVFRVHDIMSRNSFGPGNQFGEEDARHASTGLWVHAAYMNHSCIANVDKEFIGDVILIRAYKPIAKGEEILHCYDFSSDYDKRQATLMNVWGFECDCAFCAAEKSDGKEVREKREELRGEADAFVAREPWAGANRIKLAKAQKLAKAIEESYDSKYKDLPRPAGMSIFGWLDKALPRK